MVVVRGRKEGGRKERQRRTQLIRHTATRLRGGVRERARQEPFGGSERLLVVCAAVVRRRARVGSRRCGREREERVRGGCGGGCGGG